LAYVAQDFKGADPRKRMRRFFDTLYSSLNRGARAVLQIYPENAVQAQSLTMAAMRAGFSGGLVVDFPHSTRAKKYFLVLMVGGTAAVPEPKGLSGEASDEEEATVSIAGRSHPRKKQRTGGHSQVSCKSTSTSLLPAPVVVMLLSWILVFQAADNSMHVPYILQGVDAHMLWLLDHKCVAS
jgi:hypothetical protein